MGEALVSEPRQDGVVVGEGRQSVAVFCDGAMEPVNPGGHGAAAFIVQSSGKTIHTESIYLGKEPGNTNNLAEYVALIRALEYLRREVGDIKVSSDSKLLIEQMRGNWKAKGGAYFFYHQDAKALVEHLRSQGRQVEFNWIPREKNFEADKLCLDELARHGVRPAKRKR